MFAGVAALTLASAGVAVLGSVQPAAANPVGAFMHASSWAYVDSRNPDVSYLNTTGDAPVGALRDADGKSHKYRSFFAFDVNRFVGTQVSQAILVARETQAQDCVDRQVELWSTGAVDSSTTWENSPVESQKLDTVGYDTGSGCPAPRLEWDATAAVQQAVAAGSSVLTLELRVPEANEGDTHLGRQFANNLAMTVNYNTPPGVPTDLRVDQLGCATEQPYPWEPSRDPMLSAIATDPDQGQSISVEFAVWPVDHPDQRTSTPMIPTTSGHWASWPLEFGSLADGTAYGFAARAIDQDGASSMWSQPCYFQTDYTAPANPPLVSSTDYSADGMYAPADRPGGSGTVDIAPRWPWDNRLTARSVDRAGNLSGEANYYFNVRNAQPLIISVGGPKLGKPFRVGFAPGDLPAGYGSVVSYTYTVNGGPEQSLPAGPDGTASVELTFASSSIVEVRSTSGNGWASPTVTQYFYPDASPSVSSDIYPESGTGGGVGQTGTFTFGANFGGSTEFYYSFDWGSTWLTAPVGPDGTASVTWTPDAAGVYDLYIYSQTADGTQSDWYPYEFYVNE